jgi:hypothetical protein
VFVSLSTPRPVAATPKVVVLCHLEVFESPHSNFAVRILLVEQQQPLGHGNSAKNGYELVCSYGYSS